MYKADISDIQLRTLPALLKTQAENNAQTPFLVTDTESITYSEAYMRCLSLASALSNLGLKKDDHLVLYLHNCPEMALLAVAANILQAIWIPISTDYKGAWLDDAIERSRPTIVVTQASLINRITIDENTPLICTDTVANADTAEQPLAYKELLISPPHRSDFSQIGYGDTSAIVWTSGTTGKSKGVMVSHNCWLRPIIQGTCIFYDSQPGDIIFNVLPMYHAGA